MRSSFDTFERLVEFVILRIVVQEQQNGSSNGKVPRPMKLKAMPARSDGGGYSVWITEVAVKDPRQHEGQSFSYCEKLADDINRELEKAGLLWDK